MSSVVEYFPGEDGSRCGYCKSLASSYSHGMWAHRLTVQDYQDLIDRGWRRSGKYTYKPTMKKTCCPQYTIKCGVLDFQLNKSHKKCLKKVHKFLNTGIRSGTGDNVEAQEKAGTSTVAGKTTKERQKEKQEPAPGKGPDPTKPPCKKAKLLRLEKKKQKLAKVHQEGQAESHGLMENPSGNSPKSIDQWLKELSTENPKHKLEIRLVATPHTARSARDTAEFDSSYEQSYEIFKKYQIGIHKEKPHENTKSTYKSFLVDSPLEPEKPSNGPRCGYGSFHQQYWLDGKLIAVGVIDILPYCVSSVYLYYDPDYEFLNLGTYSALREIAFTRSLQKEAPDLKYYYMGFYIHSCPKMKYKGQYVPSFLLCPEACTWVPIEACTPKLDVRKYNRFEDADKVDENGVVNLDEVLVLFERQAMPYTVYKALNPRARDEGDVKEYAGFVGKKCYQRMLLFRS
ncbi:arginyl-tRNA--protein transferase 1-like isoform X2 [Lingula anatina]|uniref:Arginyl-tRNA--protein transferase 1 n=1 Tax=Lingula anatina TaxID=7574 RepID=A0A2R2MKU7_LINAN|nr:arginyl-tRNA--protein transferase 1-like isoform X2 [Lingula anatina]|eukprot:XP_023930830.1 arginyl-tRNA--protein transferase 1-like isoform X2 [Lingula anatina]